MHFLTQQNKHKTHSQSKVPAVRTAAARESKKEEKDYLKLCQYVLVGRVLLLPRAPRHSLEKMAAKM